MDNQQQILINYSTQLLNLQESIDEITNSNRDLLLQINRLEETINTNSNRILAIENHQRANDQQINNISGDLHQLSEKQIKYSLLLIVKSRKFLSQLAIQQHREEDLISINNLDQQIQPLLTIPERILLIDQQFQRYVTLAQYQQDTQEQHEINLNLQEEYRYFHTTLNTQEQEIIQLRQEIEALHNQIDHLQDNLDPETFDLMKVQLSQLKDLCSKKFRQIDYLEKYSYSNRILDFNHSAAIKSY